MKATLLHYPDTPMAELQIARPAFTGIISVTLNSWQSTMDCMVPLGRTNKATLGIKLPSATVPAWQVNCGCLCTSMNTQWLLFCSNVWKNPPTAPHPPPPPTPPPSLLPTHPLYTESRILVRPEKSV